MEVEVETTKRFYCLLTLNFVPWEETVQDIILLVVIINPAVKVENALLLHDLQLLSIEQSPYLFLCVPHQKCASR